MPKSTYQCRDLDLKLQLSALAKANASTIVEELEVAIRLHIEDECKAMEPHDRERYNKLLTQERKRAKSQ